MKQSLANLLFAGLVMAHQVFATQIIAHRGASHDAPENTLAAVNLAFEQEADACELDVHLSKDGKVVVLHDDDTRRTGGVAKKIANQNLEELLRQNVGKWGRWKYKGFSEKIPLLEQALAILPEGRRLFVEIKCGAEILPALGNVFHRAGKSPAQTVIIGFDYATMKAAKVMFPDVEVNWLVSSPGRIKKGARLKQLIEKAWAAKLDGLDLNSRFPINHEFVATVHNVGLKLYTWTVDDLRIARRQAEAGVDGITTNRPGWLREQLTART
jgi:glycerophosphoryl diester phosphodiesterase